MGLQIRKNGHPGTETHVPLRLEQTIHQVQDLRAPFVLDRPTGTKSHFPTLPEESFQLATVSGTLLPSFAISNTFGPRLLQHHRIV